MGVLTLLQIRTEVDSVMGNRSNVLDARLNTWINLAYTDIATGIEFDELDAEFTINTVVGDFDYAGPTNVLIPQLLRDNTNENLLTWIPKNEWYRLDRSTNGTPRKWTRRGTEILVHPPPDAIVAMTLVYKTAPTALAADGDVTILPAWVDNGLILLGAAYGFLALNEDQRAIVMLNRAITYLGSRLTQQDFSFLLGGLAQTQPTQGAPSGV